MRPFALGTRMWSLSPAQFRVGGIVWPLAQAAAADVPGGCFFFQVCLGALMVRWTTEEESWLLISAHLQGSCVSGCFISANFGGLMPQ